MIIQTDKTIDGKKISYEIFEDGYKIYLDEKPWISQLKPYDKPMDDSKSYEENCLVHIEELTMPVQPMPEMISSADLDRAYQEGVNEA